MEILRSAGLSLENKDLAHGVSDAVLDAALDHHPFAGLSRNQNYRRLAGELVKTYYLLNPNMDVSEGRSMEDRRVEAYMRISGEVSADCVEI